MQENNHYLKYIIIFLLVVFILGGLYYVLTGKEEVVIPRAVDPLQESSGSQDTEDLGNQNDPTEERVTAREVINDSLTQFAQERNLAVVTADAYLTNENIVSTQKLLQQEQVDKVESEETCVYGLSGMETPCEYRQEYGVSIFTVNQSIADLTKDEPEEILAQIAFDEVEQNVLRRRQGAEGYVQDRFYLPLKNGDALLVESYYFNNGDMPDTVLWPRAAAYDFIEELLAETEIVIRS